MLEANNSAILMVEHHEEIAQKVANKIQVHKTLIEQDVEMPLRGVDLRKKKHFFVSYFDIVPNSLISEIGV